MNETIKVSGPVSAILMMLAVVCVGFATTVEAQSNLPSCQGSYSTSTWNNCQGTRTWPSGEKYVGEFKDGKYNGQGTWEDGLVKYVGEWKDGEYNGQGTMTYRDGRKYVGEFKDDKINGQGTETFADGRKYVGEWKDDKENGDGTGTYADRQNYVGEWRDGKLNGQGTITYRDRRKYVGEFKDGRYNGKGKEFASDGTLVQQGYWIAGDYFGPTSKEEAEKKKAKKEEAYEKDLLAYRAREKTIIEQVLNYTRTGDENGAAWYYFVSGEKGGHKCIITQRGTNDLLDFDGWGQITDIRNMNEKGFEIRPSGQVRGGYRVGDERISFFAPEKVNIGRIQKGWGLVFSECPGKKSAF